MVRRSFLSTDGGIPVDYEERELEDEGTSSSQSYGSKLAAGTCHPREDDSDASSSKRPRSVSDAVPSSLEALPSPRTHVLFCRSNVMPRALTTQCANLGCRLKVLSQPSTGTRRSSTTGLRYLRMRYLCTSTLELSTTLKLLRRTSTIRRSKGEITTSLISLFHELRYWSSKKTLGRSRVPEWQAFCQSWNQFVENFNKDSTVYRERITSVVRYSVTSVVQHVHEGFVNANIPCATVVQRVHEVPEGVHSPTASLVLPASVRETSPGTRLTVYLQTLRSYVLNSHARVSSLVLCLSTKLRETLRPSVLRLQSVVGFVRLHHFRNVGRFGETTYLEGDPIVSNEYENEPDLGSSSDWYGQQSDPPRGESYRGQSYASVCGAGRSSYAQPRVDHGLQALHAR
ncbi:hypothetical protein PHMEG_00027442, partial [Phytophthora megakarya]